VLLSGITKARRFPGPRTEGLLGQPRKFGLASAVLYRLSRILSRFVPVHLSKAPAISWALCILRDTASRAGGFP